MEALDPLEFHDDVEVALLEVVCSWQPDEAAARHREPPPLLPVVATPSPPTTDECSSRRGSPPSRRRKYSAVASLFLSRRASEPPSPPALGDGATPPILAALESVSLSPDRPRGSGGSTSCIGERNLEPFHFGVAADARVGSPEYPSYAAHPSPPRPVPSPDGPHGQRLRGRGHSAIALSYSPLDLRTPTLAAPTLETPNDPPANKSPPRHRRSTKTNIHRAAYSLMTLDHPATDDGASPCARSGIQTPGSCKDHEEEERLLDANTANDTNTNTIAAFVEVGVAGRPGGTGFPSSSASGASVSIPLEAPITTVVTTRSSPPRLLPPIAVRSCDTQCARSPHKPSSPSDSVCAACRLTLDARHRDDAAATLVLDTALAVHRTCFHCARYLEPLTLANFHALSSVQAATTHHAKRLPEAKLPVA